MTHYFASYCGSLLVENRYVVMNALWIELFQLGEEKITALAFTAVLEPD
jgi:hypothetical protein